MNEEKVKSLIEQAHEVVFHGPVSGKTLSQLNPEKLVELVVAECIRLCQEKVDELNGYAVAGDDEFVARELGAYQCIEVICDTFDMEIP